MPRCGAAALLVILLATGAARATGPAERRCERALGKVGPRLLARSTGLLAACARAVATGARVASTDCLADAAIARRRAAAARVARRLIGRACSVEAAAALHLGGDCADARTPHAIAGCLVGTHDADADAVLAVTDAAPSALPEAARACQLEATGRTRAVLLGRVHLLAPCHRHPPRALAAGSDCAEYPPLAARLARLGSRAAARIVARCGGAALGGAHFGVPCDAPPDGAALAQCLLGVAGAAADDALAAERPNPGFCGDTRATVERRVGRLLARMTLAEKLDQMHGVSVITPGLAGRITGLARLRIPGIGMLDGARGVSAVSGTATCFPVGMARGATWDEALEERVGETIGAETRAKGGSMILAPVVNILRHPRWGRAQETYGEDTVHLGRMGVAFVRGAQRHVIANPKHYALNSIEDTRFTVDVAVDERSLREVFLPHFRRAVQEGHAGAVMAAYNQVNGAHCSENTHLLREVLDGDWGFQGFVESDWILGTRSTVRAVEAGLDVEMPAPSYFGKPLADAVAAGQVRRKTIDAAVRRTLRAQLCFRLDTDPPKADPTQVETPAHVALSLQAARESIVLLRNEAGALPLDPARVRSLVVVGPLAAMADLGDHGSSLVVPATAVSPLDGIRARAGGVTVAYVDTSPPSPADLSLIAAADAAVVVVGLTFQDEGEGLITIGDRASLALPRDQDALVAAVAAANPRTLVVLEGSGALLMPWLGQVSAVLMAWYPGEAGGTAIAEVLFGDVNPSGKLPVTFPRAETDLPPFDNTSPAVQYGYFHGYRYLDRNDTAPLFPFGFGLAYTTFRYSNLAITPATVSPWGRVRVTADVTNTGPVAGDEVAQLYVGYRGSRVDRAVRDLKAFARVHLEPGETRTVPFEVRAPDLAYWDTGAGALVVEPIAYTVEVGPSSRDLPLVGAFAVSPRR